MFKRLGCAGAFGQPGRELAMAQALLYLAAAPKSNAVYKAYNQCKEQVKSLPSFNVPMHLRNAPTALMKGLDYGKTYRYATMNRCLRSRGIISPLKWTRWTITNLCRAGWKFKW